MEDEARLKELEYDVIKMPMQSSRWNKKVTIDTDFLDILASRVVRVPTTPKATRAKTPSLADRVKTTSKNNKSKWKQGLLVTGRTNLQSLTPNPGRLSLAWPDLMKTRERRGTAPAVGPMLAPVGSPKAKMVTDAVQAGSKFKKLLSRRRESSRTSEESEEEHPKSPKSRFREMARQAVFERRLSEGAVQGGRLPSIGDVFMQELYRQVDRRKMSKLRYIASLSHFAEHRRRLRKKFQLAVKMTIFCIRSCKMHCSKVQSSGELSSFYNMNFAAMDTFEGVDLLFDPTKFKANRQARISKEMKRIFRKYPSERTEQEIYYAQIALRNIKCFADFPDRMQKKIAEVGQYLKFEPRRVLIRQGHPAHAFYFILSGAVSVVVLEEGRMYAKLMAHLEKGQSFGELAIITRSRRQSTVVVKEKSEFLAISVDDYHRIFMSGGVKSVNDPDHEIFVRSLPFLQGWPIERLQDEKAKCVFLYFKRGDVIVKDTAYSDWIIVVKSGSLAVLKKLRKVDAFEWRKPKGFTFVSEKEKRERQEKLSKLRKQVLPELNVPLRATAHGTAEDEQIREEGKLRPFQHPDVPGDLIHSDGDTKVWDLGSHGSCADNLENLCYVHVQPEVSTAQGQEQSQKMFTTDLDRPRTGGSPNVADDKKDLFGRRSHKTQAREDTALTPVDELPDSEALFKSDIRTIQQELEGEKDPDDITAADLNPEFVHVQTLTKGMVFGLSDLILGQHTSFCVVSNGADVILVNKNLYHEHASESLLTRMRQELCPYPTEEELQSRLQTSVDWDAYRQTTLADTLKSVRMRKQIRI